MSKISLKVKNLCKELHAIKATSSPSFSSVSLALRLAKELKTSVMSMEEILYVLSTFDNREDTIFRDLAGWATSKCTTKANVQELIPYIKKSWKDERRLLQRKVMELASDKSQLIQWCEELGFI